MTIFRTSLLVLLTLLLVGCATSSKGKFGEDLDDHACYTMLTNAEHVTGTAFIKMVDTGGVKLSLSDTPLKSFSGIESVMLNASELTVTSINKSLYEEYSAPLFADLHTIDHEARPIYGIWLSVFTFGIYPAVQPTHAKRLTFGCTETKLGMPHEDLIRKVKTGKIEWRETEKANKFLVSGFDKDYMFDIYMGSYERFPLKNQVIISLSKAILNTDFTKATTIKITCLDCDLLGEEEQALYKDAKKTVEITADFRAIKADLIVETAKKKVEQARRDKEDLIRKKHAQEVPLDEFKAQCQSLGFKLGSAEYGNCVLELNEAK